MSTDQIVVSVLFVMVVSVVSYFFGKKDGYEMGIRDAIELTVVTVERCMDSLYGEPEDEAE